MRLGYAHYILGVKGFYASTSSGLCGAVYEIPQWAAKRGARGAPCAQKTQVE